MGNADIGVVGLGVMGQNLALNMAEHGYQVAVYNRTEERTSEFLASDAALGFDVVGTATLEELIATLAQPRKVLLMVKSGPPVDAVLESLLPLLDEGDVVIDGGNSHFEDTARRVADLMPKGIHFVGAGVSGGEEGARRGPSIMPGGDAAAWPAVAPILQDIAAKVDDGTPCCDWIGPSGSGHYVKMVHNGIEYGDMQLIAEAYDLMRRGLGMAPTEIADVFTRWNQGRLESFLVEITADILRHSDDDGTPMIDVILDAAGQKGTGKWTVIDALHLGQPVSLIAEAVFARVVSAFKDRRVAASSVLGGPEPQIEGDRDEIVSDIEDALYASKIVSYAQGFMQLEAASDAHGWDLDLGGIALMWREGCIIRAVFLGDIRQAFATEPDLDNLLLARFFTDAVEAAQSGWRRTVSRAVAAGVPAPAYSSALAFYDSYRSARLPANLIQAQRDFFGAHTYERVDRPRGEAFHTEWVQ